MKHLKIVHVANIRLTPDTGMGRIACEWRAAALRKGYTFLHVGSDEVQQSFHYSLFAWNARNAVKRVLSRDSVILVHEPASCAFQDFPVRKIGFSHGLEKRAFHAMRVASRPRLKSLIFQPLWTSLSLSGLASMDLALLSNTEDRDFFLKHTRVDDRKVKVFRNGVHEMEGGPVDETNPTVVFNASWLDRKGKGVLVKAATALASRGYQVRWLLIGTGKSVDEVKADWPAALRENIRVIPAFRAEDESFYLRSASIFVLPSYFEGAPLSLLQAMRGGLCSIASACCGQKDLINHETDGLLFEPGNDNALAAVLERAIVDPVLRAKLGENAKATVAGYTWTKVADEVIDWIALATSEKLSAVR